MTQLDDLNVKLDTLETDVAKETTVGDSMATLLAALKALYDAAIGGATDLSSAQARVGAVSATVEAKTAAWAAAVIANTPPPAGGNPIALPDGVAGAAYSATLEAIPGLAPFTNSATGLPDGMTADITAPLISAPAAVVADPTAVPPIEGTPGIAAGDYTIVWTSTDSDPATPAVIRNYTLKVVPAA